MVNGKVLEGDYGRIGKWGKEGNGNVWEGVSVRNGKVWVILLMGKVWEGYVRLYGYSV